MGGVNIIYNRLHTYPSKNKRTNERTTQWKKNQSQLESTFTLCVNSLYLWRILVCCFAFTINYSMWNICLDYWYFQFEIEKQIILLYPFLIVSIPIHLLPFYHVALLRSFVLLIFCECVFFSLLYHRVCAIIMIWASYVNVRNGRLNCNFVFSNHNSMLFPIKEKKIYFHLEKTRVGGMIKLKLVRLRENR